MPGTLEIRRDSEKDIKIRDLQVLLDGKEVGHLVFGDSIRLTIEPGVHNIKVTNTLYSRSQKFEIEDGETITFQAGNKMPAAWAWFLMMVCVAPYGVILTRVENAEILPDIANADQLNA